MHSAVENTELIRRLFLDHHHKEALMNDASHWNSIYTRHMPTDVSWYRDHLEHSLMLIERCALSHDAHIADIGGGAATLLDDLLTRGFARLTVMDLSERALEVARARLGPSAEDVQWIAGDATEVWLDAGSVDLWHDRAVFHFLTDEADRRAYLKRLRHALAPEGFVILATFAPDGLDSCSGLPVRRYSPEDLHAVLGDDFVLLDDTHTVHCTPSERSQTFTYALFQLHDS